jgi:ribosomal protein S18 acetylase RimI-like enzyme
MQVRAATISDLDRLPEIDATIESSGYLHLERTGEGVAASWKLEERLLRTKLIDSNAATDDQRFSLRQVLSGIEEGAALAAEHEGDLTALAVAQIDPTTGILRLLDIRVDYDLRRQGIGTAMLFQLIATARDRSLRAVTAQAPTNNLPANQFFAKTGFELTGFDTHLRSNHDLVKEAVTLFWYAAMD